MRKVIVLVVFCGASAAAQEESVTEARRPGKYQKILTPTQIDAWTLEGRQGETLFAHVWSEEFDPVLELLGPDGKQLRSVDDPGHESRYAAELPSAGTYKVRVRGFQDKAGGKYVLAIERFVASPAELDRPVVAAIGEDGVGHVRVAAARGQLLVPSASSGRVRLGWAYDSAGKPITDFDRFVEARGDGPHYFAARGEPGARFTFLVCAGRAADLKTDDPAKGELREGGLHVYRLDGRAGDFRLFEIAVGGGIEARLAHVPAEGEQERGLVAPGEDEPLTFFPVSGKGPVRRIAARLGRTGKFQVRLLPRAGSAESYTVRMSDPTIALAVGRERPGELPVGGAAFFSFETKAPCLLQIDLASDRFDPLLRLYDGRGKLIETDDDGGVELSSRITRMIRVEGAYRLQVSSVGDGGGGAFRVNIEEKQIQALKVGERGEGRLTAGTSDFWTVEARKDQVVILSARSASCDVALRVFDTEGVELASGGASGVDGVSLAAVRFPRDGAYSVQVWSGRGAGPYALRAIDEGTR